MTKKISFMNPKGGAGKTISSINFSYGLVNRGFKVLLIDTDPRGGVGTSLGIKNKNTIFEMIREYKENFITDKNKYITIDDFAYELRDGKRGINGIGTRGKKSIIIINK